MVMGAGTVPSYAVINWLSSGKPLVLIIEGSAAGAAFGSFDAVGAKWHNPTTLRDVQPGGDSIYGVSVAQRCPTSACSTGNISTQSVRSTNYNGAAWQKFAVDGSMVGNSWARLISQRVCQDRRFRGDPCSGSIQTRVDNAQ